MIDLKQVELRYRAGDPVLLGSELYEARKVLGYTTRELASVLNMGENGHSELAKMERGRRRVTGPIATAVLLLLDRKGEISLSDFL